MNNGRFVYVTYIRTTPEKPSTATVSRGTIESTDEISGNDLCILPAALPE